MSEKIELTIDGQQVSVEPGTTILEAARQAGVGDLPALCYSEQTTANGLCRLCLVETEGANGLQAACVTAARPGAVVHTRSTNIARARRTILEMLAASVDLSDSIELQALLDEYQARLSQQPTANGQQSTIIDDNPVYVRDYAKCVLCWRCVQVCAEDAQYTHAINFSGRGFDTQIATFFDRPLPETTCVFCGQCVGVCPTGALVSKREHLLEQGVPPEEVFAITRLQGKNQRVRRRE